jgi:hypothetical protein
MADNKITLQLTAQELELLGELETMLKQIKQEEGAINGAIQEMNTIKKESGNIDKSHIQAISLHLGKVHGLLSLMDKFNSIEEQEISPMKTKLSFLLDFIGKLGRQLR